MLLENGKKKLCGKMLEKNKKLIIKNNLKKKSMIYFFIERKIKNK